MLYRLYLSLLWLLVAGGVVTTGTVVISQAHDHVVVAEDRACFKRETDTPAKRAAEARFAAGEDLSDEDMWYLSEALTDVPGCHVKSYSLEGAKESDLSAFYSTRGWFSRSLDFTFDWGAVALSLLSFLPAVALVLLRRWWRWVAAGARPE